MSSFHEHCMITFLASMASMWNIILNISVMVRICVSLLISKGKLSTCHQYITLITTVFWSISCMKLKRFIPTINSPTYFLAWMDVILVWCGWCSIVGYNVVCAARGLVLCMVWSLQHGAVHLLYQNQTRKETFKPNSLMKVDAASIYQHTTNQTEHSAESWYL